MIPVSPEYRNLQINCFVCYNSIIKLSRPVSRSPIIQECRIFQGISERHTTHQQSDIGQHKNIIFFARVVLRSPDKRMFRDCRQGAVVVKRNFCVLHQLPAIERRADFCLIPSLGLCGSEINHKWLIDVFMQYPSDTTRVCLSCVARNIE